ncbi:MAG: DNA repair protein RadA [Vicinamibacterales bacterium]|nr:DNA repair protein RadA [Vicinamibacterales bacterium]
MKGPNTVFVCQSCGAQSRKWLGRCSECDEWNSLVEERTPSAHGQSNARPELTGEGARLYADIESSDAERISSGVSELDRVLGGGMVPGSLVLLGGEPGIGKSTLLLQAAARVAETGRSVLYCSGEESPHQVRARGERLGVTDAPLYLLAETCLERVLEEITRLSPGLVIVDSIQTMFSSKLESAPGTIGQVREVATQLLFTAKGRNVTVLIVGHVTKDGNLAGPKVLEHVVDTVLSFEGDRHHAHRVVRAVKNRFGAVSELGVFRMTATGLETVPNPSQLFLSERKADAPGSVVLCSIEGSRPILVEVQALVGTGAYGNAQRVTSGVDRQRLSLLLTVLEKRVGLHPTGEDVFVNVPGGVLVNEPAADLAVVAAVASSMRNRPVLPRVAVFGEVGLAGEIRGVNQAGLRVREAAQMGFTRCLMPSTNRGPDIAEPGCELIGVNTVEQALEGLFA